jgi:hypothetical protein
MANIIKVAGNYKIINTIYHIFQEERNIRFQNIKLGSSTGKVTKGTKAVRRKGYEQKTGAL